MRSLEPFLRGSTPIRSTMKKRWEFSQERLES
nr:MAG TPA: hypothetical protein [Caudoviricetes sp.]